MEILNKYIIKFIFLICIFLNCFFNCSYAQKNDIGQAFTNDERIVCCDLVRDLLTEKTNAEYRWFHENGIGLENSYTRYHPTEGRDNDNIASNWVHYDVRTFNLEYLEDQYFVKLENEINGKNMKELIIKI